jgi:hypothetical protein
MSLRSNWKVTITPPRRAVLKIGLFTLKWSPVSMRVAVAIRLLSVGIYLALLAWYYASRDDRPRVPQWSRKLVSRATERLLSPPKLRDVVVRP